MPDEEPASYQAVYGRRLSVEEFLVDFLGGLVPGVLFLAAATFALIPPVQAVMVALSGRDPEPIAAVVSSFLTALQNTPSALWVTIVLGAILLAYIMGHLFYRHDPKRADRSSFRRVAGPKRRRVEKYCKANFGCASPEQCEFPYPDFGSYLRQRGLIHLLPFITWEGEEGEASWRSKTYVNLLKVRLRFHHPDKCGAIIRNEAHVRLASSTWYVSLILLGVGLIGVAVAGGAIAAALIHQPWELVPDWQPKLGLFLPAILSPVIVVLLSLYSWWTIRGFLHYQRLREVFFVLETAFTAFSGNYELLEPPFEKAKFNG